MDLGLVRRVAREKRRLVVLLGVATVINLALYLMVVVPWSARVSAADERTRSAESALHEADREDRAARTAADGKALAERDLKTFYREILPADLDGARRISYRKLAELARESHLTFRRRGNEPARERSSALGKLRITMVLEGQYDDVRRFIHSLETSPEFMVIENVAIAESVDTGGTLVLTIEVATYFPESERGPQG